MQSMLSRSIDIRERHKMQLVSWLHVRVKGKGVLREVKFISRVAKTTNGVQDMGCQDQGDTEWV